MLFLVLWKRERSEKLKMSSHVWLFNSENFTARSFFCRTKFEHLISFSLNFSDFFCYVFYTSNCKVMQFSTLSYHLYWRFFSSITSSSVSTLLLPPILTNVSCYFRLHKSHYASGIIILMVQKQSKVSLRGSGLPLATQKSEALWPSLTVISLDDSESRMSGGTEMEKRSSLFSEMFIVFEFTWSFNTYGWRLCSQSAFLMVSCWFGTCDKKGGLGKTRK